MTLVKSFELTCEPALYLETARVKVWKLWTNWELRRLIVESCMWSNNNNNNDDDDDEDNDDDDQNDDNNNIYNWKLIYSANIYPVAHWNKREKIWALD